MSKNIKRFIDNYKTKYDEFTLSLSAGFIDEDGTIVRQQFGIEDTFSVGMPIYSLDNIEIGRLSIGLYSGLDYSDKTSDGLSIPVEFWEIKGYKGEYQKIKTYHQVIQPTPAKQEKSNE